MRLRGEAGDEGRGKKDSPFNRLEKARNKVFSKELALLSGLRQHLAFTAWEPTFGGKFPKKEYEAIVTQTQHLLNYMSLISYATTAWTLTEESTEEEKKWITNYSRLIKSINVTSHEITSMLSLLSGEMVPITTKSEDIH